ncbi:MAG: cytochrome P450 [Dehalococcoidia bacterium]
MSTAIPRYPGQPIVGSLPEIRRDVLGMLRGMAALGDIVSYRFGPSTEIFVNSPELVGQILVDEAEHWEKVAQIRLLRPLVGNGLVSSPNEFHRRQRKLVAPAFQHRRVASYADTMVRHAEDCVAGWADGETIDVANQMMQLSLRIVCQTLFSSDIQSEADRVGAAMTKVIRTFTDYLRSFPPIPLSVPLPRNRAAKRAIAELDAVIFRIIAERRADPADRGDLLSMLLAAHDEDDGSFMTDQQVRDEVMTLFVGGHETTALALSWAWAMLDSHPDEAACLRAEADVALAGRSPVFADLTRLPYAAQVFKESLRICPPVALIGRNASRDSVLGGHPVKKGTNVTFAPYTIHRRTDIYPDPERFDPDRFLPENEARIPRHGFLPFGGGPRICIGNQFAMMEGQLLLATIAQRVELSLVPGYQVEPDPQLTLRIKGGLPMTVRRRA